MYHVDRNLTNSPRAQLDANRLWSCGWFVDFLGKTSQRQPGSTLHINCSRYSHLDEAGVNQFSMRFSYPFGLSARRLLFIFVWKFYWVFSGHLFFVIDSFAWDTHNSGVVNYYCFGKYLFGFFLINFYGFSVFEHVEKNLLIGF